MDNKKPEEYNLERSIAKRIRQARQELDWTLEDLAEATRFSKGHLSQIENGEKVPPISSLRRIAAGLGIHFNYLITGEETYQASEKISLGKLENRISVLHLEAAPKSVYESFGFTKQDRMMDAYVITMGPDFPPKAMMHSGQEFFYTLEGVHEFYYDGRIYQLKAGESVYCDSDRPHMGRSISRKPARVLVVFCNSSNK